MLEEVAREWQHLVEEPEFQFIHWFSYLPILGFIGKGNNAYGHFSRYVGIKLSLLNWEKKGI